MSLTWAASVCVGASCHCLCLWVVGTLMPQVSPGLSPGAQGCWGTYTTHLGSLVSQALPLQGKKGRRVLGHACVCCGEVSRSTGAVHGGTGGRVARASAAIGRVIGPRALLPSPHGRVLLQPEGWGQGHCLPCCSRFSGAVGSAAAAGGQHWRHLVHCSHSSTSSLCSRSPTFRCAGG